MAVERSVKPPEHPAMRTARLRFTEGDILARFLSGGAICQVQVSDVSLARAILRGKDAYRSMATQRYMPFL